MTKYTYDNVLINPSNEGIESLIGKEVYFEAKPYLCLKAANEKLTSSLGILVEVYKDSINPFCVKGKSGSYKYPCIIEKKEDPKPKYVPFENVTEFLDAYRRIERLRLRDKNFYLSIRGIWLKDKDIDGVFYMVTEIWKDGVVLGSDQYPTKWDDLLDGYTFPDGSPCGNSIEVEQEGNCGESM